MADGTPMRAKVRCSGVQKYENGTEQVTFNAVAKSERYPDDGSDEDNTYARWSPSASFTIHIANPALIGKYAIGQRYYVDFTPTE